MSLSKRSLDLLQTLFAENSNLSLPVGIAEQIIEIREWIIKELEKQKETNIL